MNKRNEGPDRRLQILEAAAAVVTRRGLQAFTFENVAAEVGLSRQLVRYYYADPDALMIDLCDHLANIYRRLLVEGILQVQQIKRLDFFLDFFFDLAEGHPMPGNIEAYDAMVAYSVGSAGLRERMCAQYLTLSQVIVNELQIAHPQLPVLACEELSFQFVSMMHSYWSFVASLGYTRAHGILVRRAIDRLIESYLRDPTPAPLGMRPWTRAPGR